GIVLSTILNRDSIHEHPMRPAVALHERRSIDTHYLAVGVFQRLGRKIWIEPYERLTHAAFQDDIQIIRVAALSARPAHRNLGAVEHRVAHIVQPSKRS